MYKKFLYRLDAPLDNKFALISLLCYITHQMREKKKDWKVMSSLELIRKGKESRNSQDLIHNLCELCEDLMYGQTVFPTFDLKSYKEMFKVINSILDMELPFRNKEKEECPF